MNDHADLVFVASLPRSGSTYLQRLLSNNEETATTSEPWIMLALAPLFKSDLVASGYNQQRAVNALRDYLDKAGHLGLDEEIASLAERFYALQRENKKLFIDKTPRYWEIMEDLLLLFPRCKLIVLKRNPVDVVKSMINTWGLTKIDELIPAFRDLTRGPYVLCDLEQKSKGNDRIRFVSYEQLLEDPERVVKGLYEWLGLEYSQTVLNTDENTKTTGLYGDPYQNGMKKRQGTISKELGQFLKGYEAFLGEDFLKRYGNYKCDRRDLTFAFRYYLQRCQFSKGEPSILRVCSLKVKYILRRW